MNNQTPTKHTTDLFRDFSKIFFDLPIRAKDLSIRETDSQIFLSKDVPGFRPSDISVSFVNGVLIVKGTADKDNAFRNFEKSWQIGNDIDAKSAKASVENGVLNITLNKTQNLFHIPIQ